MTEYVGYLIGPAFIVLLLISVAAVLLLVSSRFSPTPIMKKIETSTKLITAITAFISLLVSAVGVAVPLTPANKDEAQSALELYLDSIRTKHFQTAYDILSEARKEEKRRRIFRVICRNTSTYTTKHRIA
jgi:hypothetical protein